jgi:tRNA/rRNA methyltransferase
MSASDMAQCNIMLGIPTNPNFGSLNVAAAVQIVAYDWRMAIGWDVY